MPSLAYAWPPSVADGEEFTVHVSATTGTVAIEIARVGAHREVVWRAGAVAVDDLPLPDDVVARGCGWPPTCAVHVDGWRSGYYEIVVTGTGEEFERAATS